MVRVSKAPASRERRRRVLKRAKGYRTARGSLIRIATEAVERGLAYAYRDRKVRKREFRNLWVARIGAACKEEGLSYSKFMDGLKKARVGLNRKILADLAVHDRGAFQELVKIARGAAK